MTTTPSTRHLWRFTLPPVPRFFCFVLFCFVFLVLVFVFIFCSCFILFCFVFCLFVCLFCLLFVLFCLVCLFVCCFVFCFFHRNDRKGWTLDYLNGLGYFFFGLGDKEKPWGVSSIVMGGWGLIKLRWRLVTHSASKYPSSSFVGCFWFVLTLKGDR